MSLINGVYTNPGWTNDEAPALNAGNLNDISNAIVATQTEVGGLRAAVGSPLTASLVSEMTDGDKVYVYTGSETGYTAGNWYYSTDNGTTWTSGGVYNAVACDTALSASSTNAVQNSVVNEAITDLKSDLGDGGIIKLEGFNLSSGLWAYDARVASLLIPVESGRNLSVVATSVGSSTPIAALKNVVLPVADGDTATFSGDAGWTGPITIDRNSKYTDKTPSDIQYLYVYLGFTSAGYNRAPVRCAVDGYDYMQDAVENIMAVCNSVTKLEDEKVDDIQNAKNLLRRVGYITDGVWSDDTPLMRFSHILYPVKDGDIVEVYGKEGNTAYIAGLTTSDIAWGDAPMYSSTVGWTSPIPIENTQHWYGVVPADVNYMYLYYGTDGSRLPAKVLVNGYDVVASIAENVTEYNTGLKRKLSDLEYFGDAINGAWANIGDSRYSYIIVPVNNGDIIDIISNSQSGSTTYVGMLKTYSNPVSGENLDMSTEEGFEQLITIEPNLHKKLVVPEDTKYMYVYEGLTESKVKRPKLILVNGYDIISGRQITDDTPVNIRLMQYNIGKFAFGYSNNPSGSTFGLLSLIAYDVPGARRKHQDYTYDEYVTNYRKMLCEYQPDIIGMEEYVNPINVMVTTDPEVCVEKNMADEVFDMPYPKYVYTAGRQQCLRSKIEPIASNLFYVNYSANGQTYTSSFTVGYYIYHGKIVCVACHAMYSDSDSAGMARRSAELQAILDVFQDEEYVFLTFDVNNGGNWRTTPEGTSGYVSSPEEGETLLNIAKSRGWNFAHGGYLPFEKTWFSPTGSGYDDWYMTIDNIIYKDNGKTVFRNFEKMPIDDARKLSSDHCPVIGDFLLI